MVVVFISPNWWRKLVALPKKLQNGVRRGMHTIGMAAQAAQKNSSVIDMEVTLHENKLIYINSQWYLRLPNGATYLLLSKI